MTSLLPLGPGSPFGVDVNGVSSPALLLDTLRQPSVDVISQATNESIEQSLMSSSIAGDIGVDLSPVQSATTMSSPCSTIKRTQKLEALLEAIKDGDIPDKSEFNDTVRGLYQNSSVTSQSVTSMEQFGHILGRLGNISSAVGIIYSLLSWEVFRWEEERLVRDERRALLAAAKQVRYLRSENAQLLRYEQVNEKMAELSNRRARTKDWASDGRRAAGMVFGSIRNLSTAAQSFALLILAGRCFVPPSRGSLNHH